MNKEFQGRNPVWLQGKKSKGLRSIWSGWRRTSKALQKSLIKQFILKPMCETWTQSDNNWDF